MQDTLSLVSVSSWPPNPTTARHALPRAADVAFLSLRRRSSASAFDGTLEQTRQQVTGEGLASQPALQPLFGIPACADEDTSDGAAIGPGSLQQAKVASSLVIELLDRAADALNRDPAAAKECIARLCALLQAHHDAVQLGGGGLAPWQVQRVRKHVDAALESTIRARDCAKKIAHLSTGQFSRSFKVSFGETSSTMSPTPNGARSGDDDHDRPTIVRDRAVLRLR